MNHPKRQRLRLFAGLPFFLCSIGACNLIVGIQDIEVNSSAGTCEKPDVIVLNAGETAEPLGQETTNGQDTLVTAPAGCKQARGREYIYRVKAASQGVLTATLHSSGTSFDSVLYAQKDVCKPTADHPPIVCNDLHDGPVTPHGGEVISFYVNKNDEVDIVVDGHTDADVGNYQISISLQSGLGCMTAVPITIDPGAQIILSTYLPKDLEPFDKTICGDCFGNNCAGKAWQTIYQLNSTSPTTIHAVVESNLDTVLYSRLTCEVQSSQIGGQPGCVDMNGASAETLNIPASAAPVFLFVDYGGAGALTGGPATVVLLADPL
jgi:hypothetical protein